LEPLLLKSSPECLALTGKLQLIPGSEELIEDMESFDFELAMIKLSKLKEKY